MKKIDKRYHLPYFELWTAIIFTNGDIDSAQAKRIIIDEHSKIHTWYQLLKELELDKTKHALIIGERALEGKVYRYNNYNECEIIENGTTKGYA